MMLPHIQEITFSDPAKIFSNISSEKWAILLESSKIANSLGQFSFIVSDPFLTLESKEGNLIQDGRLTQADPWQALQTHLKKYTLPKIHELPPLQGGAVGYFSYDLCHSLEKLPRPAKNDLQFSDMMVGFYDTVIAFDHLKKRAWIISSGFPETDDTKRAKRAKERCAHFLEKITRNALNFEQNAICKEEDIESNFSETKYLNAVQKAIDYIKAGDIFEVNLSQRFSAKLPMNLKPFQLYLRLREFNAAPFAAYLNLGDTVIASASPERFLKLNDRFVETRPIKGTRPRGASKEEDQKLKEELRMSEKDHAENVMIVDLLRNDLSKVCKDESVHVPQLCEIESYATVHHLVSVVQAELRDIYTAVDLLKACFPGGSITGAPKIRAMEIIAEIEPVHRGPYCGSLGYISFSGDMDTSIIIRTFLIKNEMITFQAGGAIVADSSPNDEYHETLNKASALKRSLMSTLD
jgi:para-aminobenzoate synthetase component I